MRPDLDNLKREIERLLREGNFIVFHGESRFQESLAPILWDSQNYSDPRGFLDIAAALGTRLIVFHHREFHPQALEEAMEKLEAAQMPRERHREAERELRRLESYSGFTCLVELSFEFDSTTYLYEATTPWFDDYMDLLDQIDEHIESSGEEPPPMSGYFSQN